jgi:hypothetical protein
MALFYIRRQSYTKTEPDPPLLATSSSIYGIRPSPRIGDSDRCNAPVSCLNTPRCSRYSLKSLLLSRIHHIHSPRRSAPWTPGDMLYRHIISDQHDITEIPGLNPIQMELHRPTQLSTRCWWLHLQYKGRNPDRKILPGSQRTIQSHQMHCHRYTRQNRHGSRPSGNQTPPTSTIPT